MNGKDKGFASCRQEAHQLLQIYFSDISRSGETLYPRCANFIPLEKRFLQPSIYIHPADHLKMTGVRTCPAVPCEMPACEQGTGQLFIQLFTELIASFPLQTGLPGICFPDIQSAF